MNKKQISFIKIIVVVYAVILFLLTIYFTSYNNNVIKIGTKNFTEQRLIAYMLEDVIEANTSYEVEVITNLGETSFLHAAMLKGDIDIYIEYTSTAYEMVLKQSYAGESSEEIYQYVDQKYNETYDLDWYTLLGFENTNAIICASYCIENDITTLEELSKQEDFSFSAPANFYTRSDGFVLLEEVYGINIPNSNKYKMDTTLIYQSVKEGEVDVGLGFSTDGRLYSGDYIILEDNLNAFPKYDAGIVVSNEALEEFEGLEEQLLLFENLIDTKTMQELNYLADIEMQQEQEVAEEFVREQGLIE